MTEALPDVWKGVYGSSVLYPPVNPCVYDPQWLPHIGGLIRSTAPIKVVIPDIPDMALNTSPE